MRGNMQKIINVDGQDILLKINGGFLIDYKMRFKKDVFQEFFKIANALSNTDEDNSLSVMSTLDMETIYNIIYLMAKTADNSIPDEPVEWFRKFDSFPIADILTDAVELMADSFIGDNQKKTKMKLTKDHLQKATN